MVTPEDVEKQRVKASTPHRQVHHKASDGGSGHVRDDRKFFEAILAELENAEAWLIAGPDKTRNDLDKYLDQHAEELKKKLSGVEAMERPTDGELLAQARKLFQVHASS